MFGDYPQLCSEFEAILSFMICVNTHPDTIHTSTHIYHISAYTHTDIHAWIRMLRPHSPPVPAIYRLPNVTSQSLSPLPSFRTAICPPIGTKLQRSYIKQAVLRGKKKSHHFLNFHISPLSCCQYFPLFKNGETEAQESKVFSHPHLAFKQQGHLYPSPSPVGEGLLTAMWGRQGSPYGTNSLLLHSGHLLLLLRGHSLRRLVSNSEGTSLGTQAW